MLLWASDVKVRKKKRKIAERQAVEIDSPWRREKDLKVLTRGESRLTNVIAKRFQSESYISWKNKLGSSIMKLYWVTDVFCLQIESLWEFIFFLLYTVKN